MAGGFSDEDLQRVRDASDLATIVGERVPLRPKGRDLWCCCPFHQEKTPSMKVDPHAQLWHCFGCHEGGDVFSFVMKLDGLSFVDAVHALAQRAGITLESSRGRRLSDSRKGRLREVCDETASLFHLELMRSRMPGAQEARTYLAGRDLGGEVPGRWRLGYAPGSGALVRHLRAKGFSESDMIEANVASMSRDGRLRDRFYNRVMFPINDAAGACIAFGGRVIGQGEPKYLNSQETPLFHKSHVLFGLDRAKASLTSTGTAVVCEGYTDVIALHEAGIQNAVATLGTALTMSHIRTISRHARHRIVYLFDGDAAGQRAADRALEFIDDSMTPEAGRLRIELAAVTLPGGLDPADFVRQHGAQPLRELIENAQPLIAYGIERRLAAHDLGTAEGRTRALTAALEVLAPIKGSLLAKDYAVQIADRCRAREEDVLDRLARLRPPARREGESRAAAPGREQVGAAATSSDGSGFSGTSSESAPAAAAPSSERSLSEAERNRIRVERELLCLFVRRPDLALSYPQALAQTTWRSDLHATLATSLLATLSESAGASSATLVTNAARADARAERVLTASAPREGLADDVLAPYLVDDLAIGDLEAAVADMRASLAGSRPVDSDEREMLFQGIVELQRSLRALRAQHRLPSA
ncbi:DNA primase [Berryella wangjianweii]|uniref:DNA primase n=1 Tax=Berryella wangjianweii TaxID=2734634 RepID=A0A6M8IWF8_9ACTN|nr:DNA primase [Berryella wangjianweii]QKF07025.1 DNA primase [Berryella wangjianweii]